MVGFDDRKDGDKGGGVVLLAELLPCSVSGRIVEDGDSEVDEVS